MSLDFIWMGSNPLSGNKYLPYTDTRKWGVWGLHINVTSGTGSSSIKTISGTLNNKETGWISGNFGTTSNTYTGTLNSATPLYIGSPTNVYLGTIIDVLIYKTTHTLQERNDVLAWLDDKYYLTCPTLNSTNAQNGDAGLLKDQCIGARFGEECLQTCNAGFSRSHGDSNHECLAGEWTNSPIVCEKQCLPLVAPLNIGSCIRTILNYDNNFPDTLFDTKWLTHPRIPRIERNNVWKVSTGIVLVDTTGMPCNTYKPAIMVIDAPAWQDNIGYSLNTVFTTQMVIQNGKGGVVFRWLDDKNHYRLVFDSTTSSLNPKEVALYSVTNGVMNKLVNKTYAIMTGVTYQVTVTVRSNQISIAWDGANHFNVTNNDNRFGSLGFLSEGKGQYRTLKYETDCDAGGNCINAFPGTKCTYTCAPGYFISGGSAARTCGWDGISAQGAWDTSDLVCSINPPTINTTVIQKVNENSYIDTDVGRPIEVYSNAARAIMSFSITAENPPSGIGKNRFAINSCSGQLYLNYVDDTTQTLDYETQATYTVTVRVEPNGQASSAASGDITVQLVDVNEPALFAGKPGPITRTVAENSIKGTAIGAPVAGNDPDVPVGYRNNLYSIEVDGSGGLMIINAVTGQLTVNSSVPTQLNFEKQSIYNLRVRVIDSVNPSLTDSINVRVTLTDVNDPPTVPATQYFDIDENDATLNALFPSPIEFLDEDAGNTHTWSFIGGNVDPANGNTLFAFDNPSASAAFLKWNVDRSVWGFSNTPFLSNGRLCRAVYTATVSVTDTFSSSSSVVTVYVLANVNNTAAPTVTDFKVGTNATTSPARTSGGEQLFIYGTNFKTTYTAKVHFNKVGSGGNITKRFTTTSCTVYSTTEVRCLTPAGAGTNLVVELELDNSGSPVPVTPAGAFLVNYIPPAVSDVFGGSRYKIDGTYWVGTMDTKGGDVIKLVGTNLGNDCSEIAVTYGLYSDYELFTGVCLNASHTTLYFAAGEGQIPYYLYIKVSVGKQDYVVTDYTLTIGYTQPQITSIVSYDYPSLILPTPPYYSWGSYPVWLYFYGNNFGPYYIKGTQNRPIVRYGPSSTCQYYWDDVGCPFEMGDCYKYYGANSHNIFYCQMGESWGTNLTFVVSMEYNYYTSYSSPSHLTGAQISHLPPVMNTVNGAGTSLADTAGGQEIIIEGTNLGPLKLMQANFPNDIEVRYGNRFKYADTPATWRLRYQHRATGCKITTATLALGVLECFTDEGTGLNHDLRIMIGGQFSNVITNAINYGPPIVASFSGAGAIDADTKGSQALIIYGKNFGNDITLLNSSYKVSLDMTTRNAFPSGAFYDPASGANTLSTTPLNCSYYVNHTQLLCYTREFAGGDIKWTVNVDGQTSRDPFTFYGVPQVLNITLFDPITKTPIPYADPNCGTIALLTGKNFGRRTPYVNSTTGIAAPRQFMQWMLYSPGGVATYIRPGASYNTYGTMWTVPADNLYYVLDHNTIAVRIGPGYGTNLRFTMSVMDQVAPSNGATFSYSKPLITRVSPLNGTTLSTSDDPLRITIYGLNFPGVTDRASVAQLRFGNQEDNSFWANGIITCTRNGLTGVVPGEQSVSCILPGYNGLHRGILMAFNKPGVLGAVAEIADFIDPAKPFVFDFYDPYISYSASTTVGQYGSAEAVTVAKNVFPSSGNNTRIVTLFGRDFGYNPGDNIGREIYIRAVGDTTWMIAAPYTSTPNPASRSCMLGPTNKWWTHKSISFLTNMSIAEVKVVITAKDQPLYSLNSVIQESNIVDISGAKPSISDVYPRSGYNTEGGQQVRLLAPFAAFATGSVLTIEVGEKPYQATCGIKNLNFAGTGIGDSAIPSSIIDPSLTINFLIKTCTDQYGAVNIKSESVCQFFCTMPPTVGGKDVPMFMNKDDKLSDSAVTVDFVAPEITSVAVVDVVSVPSTTTTFDVITDFLRPVVAPTDGAYIEINGTNFGTCNVVYIGGANRLDTCTTPGVVVGHRRIWIPVPKGQGSGYNDSITGVFTNFTLSVSAGGQKSMQRSGFPIPFRYQLPEVKSISPNIAPSVGNVFVTLTGRNFGQPNIGESNLPPVVKLIDITKPYAAQECLNVSRLDHYTITCVVPEGSGADLAFVVSAGNQDGSSRPDGVTGPSFSYTRPSIHAVEVQQWNAELYNDWPKAWDANRTLFVPTSVNFTNPAVAHAPTAGRMKVTIYGANFGPRSPKNNCVHMLFNRAARDCNIYDNSITPYCFCLANAAFAAGDAKCQFTYAAEMATISSYSVPVCNGVEDFPGEGEVFDDGGADGELSARYKAGEDILSSTVTDKLGSGLILSWSHEVIELLLPPGAGSNVLTVNTRGQTPFMYNEMRFDYDAPVITSVVSLSGQIMTGPGANDIVEIRGRNFGAGSPISRINTAELPTREWLKYRSNNIPAMLKDNDLDTLYDYDFVYTLEDRGWRIDTVSSSTPIPALSDLVSRTEQYRSIQIKARTLPIKDADVIGGYHTTISWWKFCMTDAIPYVAKEPVPQWFESQTQNLFSQPSPVTHLNCGSRPYNVPGANHTAYTILTHSHSSIIVRSQPGFGGNREGRINFHNDVYTMKSTAFNFSYSVPVPTKVNTIPMYVSEDTLESIEIDGYNLGNVDDRAYWDSENDFIHYEIDGQIFYWTPPANIKAPSASSPLFPLRSTVAIPVSTYNITVGHKDVYVGVAGLIGVLPARTQSSLYIVCQNGTFGRVGETCRKCPNTARCEGFVRKVEQDLVAQNANFSLPEVYNRAHLYPEALATYYNMNMSDAFNPDGRMDANCPELIRNQFPGRDVCVVGCLPPEACLGGNICSDGYTSKPPYFACSSCANGYYRRGMECIRCPDSPWMLVIGFVLLAVSMCVGGYILNKHNVNIAFLSIAVDYMQVISMFANSRIAWPKEIKDLLHILSAFNLNIEIIAPECIKPDLSYAQKWSGIMMLPISASIIFISIFMGGYIWKRCILGQRGRAYLTAHRNSLIAMFLILFYFMYLYITRSLLEVFNCIARNPDDGYLYMSAVMEQCYKPGGTQQLLTPFAIAGLLLYTSGYPLFCAWVLHRYRFQIMLDQLLRAKGTGDSEMTNPHAISIRLRYSRLYYQYKPDLYWWMLAVVIRKFFIAFTSLMFRADGGFQMAVALLVLFAAYAAQVKCEPFMSPGDRVEVLREHDRSKFEGGIHASLAESLKEAAIVGRKRTTRIDWAAPKSVLGKQILARAGLFMFNYNTVEAVMLACAILVCLSGIMFDSLAAKRVNESPGMVVASRVCQDKYSRYCSGLIYSVITLISFSIIYLIIVVSVEIYGAIRESQMARASNAQRARMAKKLGIDGRRNSKKGIQGALERTLSKSLKDSEPEAIAAADAQFISRIGVLETAVNPLFATQQKKDDTPGNEGFLNASAITDMVQPPNPALWNVVRETYRSLLDQAQAQTSQINELKKQLQILEANSNPRDDDFEDDVRSSPNARSSNVTMNYNAKDETFSGGFNRNTNNNKSQPMVTTRTAPQYVDPSPRAQLSGYRPAGRAMNNTGRKAFAPQASRDE